MVDQHPEEWKVLCARAAVEQNAANLLKLIKRINDLLDKKQQRLEGKHTDQRAQIFQIAYDEILLVTRAELLETRGYDVQSALGNADAKLLLGRGGNYRVFLVGHAAPPNDREDMVAWIRAHFRDATVIAIRSKDERPIEIADYNFVLNGPDGWLNATEAALRAGPKTAKGGMA